MACTVVFPTDRRNGYALAATVCSHVLLLSIATSSTFFCG